MTSKINVGVKEKITKNRQSYNDQILQLSRLLSLETVRGAAHTSNLVSRLILLSKFRDSANDVILQTTGVSLFHHFLQTLSSTVLQFPASNSLLISLLEILGTAFIVGNPTQVETIFNLICQNPGYDRFLVSLLDPQCADNLTYVGLYRQLGEICGQKDRKISNQLLLSLLSKFSIDKFILFASFGEVQKVANVSYNQLVNPSIAAELYQCYLSHWLSCFGYQFPSMLEFCFQQILVGCEKQNIQFDLLNEVLLKLGINNEQTQESLVITVYDCERLISLLTYCFSTVRNFGDTLVGPNIYTKLGQYVNFFAPLMEFLMQRAMVERKDNSQAVTNCWDEIIRLYGPWLEPNVNVVPSVSVWTVDEITIAEAFVRGFVVSLATLQKMFGATCIPSPLAICWMYYSNRIAVIRSPHVYGVFHRQLLTLPWQDLCPSIDILDSFHRKLSSDNSLSNGFVTDVIVRIPWVRRDYELYYNSPDRQMCRWLLFDSVCRCVCVAENYSNCKASFPKLLEELQAIPWLDMPQHKVCETFEFLISNLDCRSILMEEDTTEAVFIRFLRFAVGFLPNYDATVIQARTARLFVKLFTSCMVGCCARSQPPVTDRICDLLLCLIADVELITRTVIDTTISTDIADLLLQELVVFWNHCSDASCLGKIMKLIFL